MRNRKTCRKTILRMIKERNITLLELEKLHQQKHVILLGGHVKQLAAMILEERDREALITEDSQRCPSSYRGVINRTIDREGGSLEQVLKRKNLNRNVEIQIQKMICDEQNIKHEEKKMVSVSRRRWNVGVRLATLRHVHLVDVVKLTEEGQLILSNWTFCGEPVTHDNMLNFNNKATCRACLRENVKRDNREK